MTVDIGETREPLPVRNILALVTDAYGGTGGIALFNRDVMAALALDPAVDEIRCIPRVISAPLEPIPAKVHFDVSATRGARAYMIAVFRAIRSRPKPDLIYCAHINLAPVAWLLSKLLGVPWSLCIYGMEVWQPSASWLSRHCLQTAHRILSISQFTLDRFLQWAPFAPGQCDLIPNAVRQTQFGILPKDEGLLESLNLSGRKIIMTMGRLDPSEQAKGFDHIIAEMPALLQELPDLAYLIVGSGGDRPRLEAMAKTLGVSERVVFAGFVSEADKPRYFALADAYVMPSKFEGFGFVFLEAMACGLPVVGSAIDGGRDALLQGELGQLVDPADKPGLRNAILTALRQPKTVPDALQYFAFENFAARLQKAIRRA